jgi:type IV pilus secretin PilQ/predicted competence protein
MSREWKRMLGLVAALGCWAAASQAQAKATDDPGVVGSLAPPAVQEAAVRNLTDLRVEPGTLGQTVVTLAADGAVTYDTQVVADPDRLVLDLHGVVNRLDRYKYPVEHGGVLRVRAAQKELEPEPVTRIVFDLERSLPWNVTRDGHAIRVTFGAAEADAAVAAAPATPTPAPAEERLDPQVAQVVQDLEARFEGKPPAEAQAAPTAARRPEAPRAIQPDLIERLLHTPALAAPAPAPPTGMAESTRSFETKTIVTDQVVYTGKAISLNLVDADLKQVFRLFHEISGLNFVLDPGVTGQVTIVLDNVPWDQALDIILKNNGMDKVLENNVIRIASTRKLAEEAAARKQLKEAKDLEVEPITITRTLSYAKAPDVERVIRDSGVLTNRGKVIVDARTNTLIISDIPKKVEPLDTLISTLDSETPQVMIEARIVETSRDFVRDLGVQWGFEGIADASKGTATGLAFPHNASVRYGLNLPGEGGASHLAFKFGNVIDSLTLDVALNTLETEGYGRVLSSPKIATQNNERAEIEQGVRIPIVNTTATEISVEFVSASLKMTVTPQITAESTIILTVEVENNSPDFVNTAGGIPSIRTQRAQTKVLIGDGGTTVIGGIFTVNEGRSEVGVPWFRKLPVFGWLFKSQNTTRQNRELLIFITPKIMRVA